VVPPAACNRLGRYQAVEMTYYTKGWVELRLARTLVNRKGKLILAWLVTLSNVEM
jgi:hypothetical protein